MRVLIGCLARIIGSKLPTVVCECLKRGRRSEQCLKTCYPQFIPQAPAEQHQRRGVRKKERTLRRGCFFKRRDIWLRETSEYFTQTALFHPLRAPAAAARLERCALPPREEKSVSQSLFIFYLRPWGFIFHTALTGDQRISDALHTQKVKR